MQPKHLNREGEVNWNFLSLHQRDEFCRTESDVGEFLPTSDHPSTRFTPRW